MESFNSNLCLLYYLSPWQSNSIFCKVSLTIGQVFGARKLNTNEDSENMLGYDLYSSALADILTEPSLSMPITVGLYAKWGSGKSFLLKKLQEEMQNFARDWIDPTFHMSPLLFFVVLHFASLLGLMSWIIRLNIFCYLLNIFKTNLFRLC